MSEETNFEVRDKRSSFSDVSAPQTKEVPTHEHASGHAPLPVTFSSFVMSLATSALMHLGQSGTPPGGESSVQLPLARQVIDLISLLEEKTNGNLTKEEQEMLTQTLFAIRMKFVEVEKKHRG